ncbi:MAG: cystathionine gamma-synthase family protein [Longimicrobiales bacterium]|nr:cystathionine gamma-synthase family protein [Longimicrobiales bacterium]
MAHEDEARRRKLGDRELRPESLMMRYGYEPSWSEGAVKPPIFQTSTFVFESAEAGKAFFEIAYGLRERDPGERPGLIYSRLNNPGLEILEDRLTLWDGAEAAAVFESGMSAITTTVMALLRPGDAVIYPEPVYGGTEYLFREVLPQFGIRAVGFPARLGLDGLREALTDAELARSLRMIHLETPSNPTNDLIDIAGCVAIAREVERAASDAEAAAPEADRAAPDAGERGPRRVVVAVDNTFLGPVFQHPLKLGADLVLYSLTKYVGGHSDVIAGACLGSDELIGSIKLHRTIFGTMAGPWTSWLLMRSLETLKLRMTSQTEGARVVADALRAHDRVARVHYLGHLEDGDAQYEVYRRQCEGAGGMISFEIEGGEAEAFRFLNALKLVKLAVSLGGTESLAEHPASMTHSDVPPAAQLEMGITPAMVRISVGVEHPDDIVADLEQALAHV